MGDDKREGMGPDDASRVRWGHARAENEAETLGPEGAFKGRFGQARAEDVEGRDRDTEGHMPVRWKATDDDPLVEGRDTDTEGHMPMKWKASDDDPLADETRRTMELSEGAESDPRQPRDGERRDEVG